MREVQERLDEQGLRVVLTPEARRWLAHEGYDPAFGARPLRRALQKHVESPLSVKLLRGEFQAGDTVQVDAGEQGLFFTRTAAPDQAPTGETGGSREEAAR